MKRSYFINFCNKLNQTICAHILSFNYFYSEQNEYFCLFLYKNKLILNFRVIFTFCLEKLKQVYRIQLYMLQFYNKSIFRGLFLKKTKKSMLTKKFYQIQNICKNRKNILNPLFILQSSRGIITHIEAYKYHIGGSVLGKIYI